MKTLIKLLMPYKWHLVAVAITDATGMVMTLCMPYIMSKIIEDGIAASSISVIIESAIVMLLLSVTAIASSLIANKINTTLTVGYTADLQRVAFEKINSLSYHQYSKIGPSGLLTRATDDIFNIEGAASGLVYTIVTVPIMLIGSTVLAFLADWVLALVFMVSIPPVMLIIFFIMRPLYDMWDKSDHYIDEQNKIVRERLSGLRVVRAFNNERKEHARAKFATEEMSKYMIRANVRGGYIEPIAMMLLNIATVVMVAVGGGRASAGLLRDAGSVVAIVQYVALISGALLNLSWTIAWLPRLRVSIRRIGEVLNMEKEDEGATDSQSAEIKISGSNLVLSKVYFTYPEGRAPTLKDVSMTVKGGERVAIIGGTGSGKSTLVRVLLSLYNIDSGEISIGGVPYSAVTRGEVRRKFSVALQRGMIFEGTLGENVRMGSPEATDGEVRAVLADCAMEGFINEHEEGLDYLLVGSGRNVSGGQKQRINMARTVIREADIYIFDDSFSALDFLTERTIKDNLAKRLAGKTQITVTQRVGTAMSAERIFVMDDGKIVASGTHSELLEACSIYREICISQLGKDAIGGDA